MTWLPRNLCLWMLTGVMSLHNNYSILYELWSGANTVRNLNEQNITNKSINNANSTSQQRCRRRNSPQHNTYGEC